MMSARGVLGVHAVNDLSNPALDLNRVATILGYDANHCTFALGGPKFGAYPRSDVCGSNDDRSTLRVHQYSDVSVFQELSPGLDIPEMCRKS
ncbi:hypothetical protein AX14_012064, partial [Amanita brunnescens Koide BX004]